MILDKELHAAWSVAGPQRVAARGSAEQVDGIPGDGGERGLPGIGTGPFHDREPSLQFRPLRSRGGG